MKYIIIIPLIVFFSSCQSAKEKLTSTIKSGEEKLFNDSVKSLDKKEAESVFSNYLLYADTYKDDTLSAAFLFKAGDLANGMQRPKEAVAVFERLRKDYPTDKKASVALFMEAFIYETALEEKEKAKEIYKDFIQKYPDHKLYQSAKASLEQLNANLSDEELIRMFEQKTNQ
jgi:TolA-binding protein